MRLVSTLEHTKIKIRRTIILAAVTTLIAGGFFIPKVFGAGGPGLICDDGTPVAYFSLDSSNKGVGTLDVSFNASNTLECDNPIASYNWNFDDGSLGSGEFADHQYQVGVFHPSLTVIDTEGLSRTYAYPQDIIVKANNQNPTLNDISVTVFHQNSTDIDISTQASDPDGDDLTNAFHVDGIPGYGSITTENGVLSSYGFSGQYKYRSTNYYASGQDVFTVNVDDGFGGSATATMTINLKTYVTGVDDNAVTYEGTPVTIDVIDNDYSYYGESVVTGPYAYDQQGGSAIVNPDGTITFTPSPGFIGTGKFEYIISSSNPDILYVGHAYTYIDVQPDPNTAPVAVNDNLNINEDSSGSINILSNDSDPDGDSITASIVGGPSHGTASLASDGTLSYTPAGDFYGDDTITYLLTDSFGKNSSIATVAVTVNSVNDVPVALNDNSVVDEDSAININVLSNDSDIEDSSLSTSLISGPSHGTVVKNSDQTFTYMPNANYNGSDSFVYSAVDSNGASTQATVNITVASINDNPFASFSASMNNGGKASFNADESIDDDGQIVTYHWDFGDGSTMDSSSPSTTHKYSNRNATYHVVLTVTDDQGATATYSAYLSK